jgi:hypothetical protein
MEINLEQLKKNFLTIKDIRSKVTSIFTILETHLLNLKKTYSEFVENNRQHLFVFGLDSFQFQSKLIDIEYDDMKRLFLAINNRMYCEYYKLYKIISEYVKENIQDKKTLDLIKITNIFPVYKDLEPYKQYKFESIQDVHENIILLLYEINEFIINKENELQIHKKKQEIGLNINNFVTTFNYNIMMIKEKGLLFISYIEFFHNLHTKYLQRFTMKMNLMYNQVIHDIRFDDTHKVSETKKQELIKNYETENIDKSLIKEIKKSFDDSDSNSSDTPQKSNKLNEISLVSNKNMNTLPVMENSVCLKITHPTKIITSESIQKEELSSFSPVKGKYKDIFKSNVNKLVNSMRIFKKKSDNLLVSVSSESSINNMNILESKNEDNGSIVFESIPVENNIELKIKEESKMDEVNINRTKSAEEIFMEISKQCNTLTENFLYQERQDSDIMEFLDLYQLKENNIVERDIVDNKIENIQDVENTQDLEIIKAVIDKIIERVEEDVKIKKEQKDFEDENMSVITMESLINEKNIEIKEKKDVILEGLIKKQEDKINSVLEESVVVKKKRTYKPRKNKNSK